MKTLGCAYYLPFNEGVVTDFSADSFLLILRNFINRRRVPLQIKIDNGTNFVGIKKELRNEAHFLDHNEITRNLTPLGIKRILIHQLILVKVDRGKDY